MSSGLTMSKKKNKKKQNKQTKKNRNNGKLCYINTYIIDAYIKFCN